MDSAYRFWGLVCLMFLALGVILFQPSAVPTHLPIGVWGTAWVTLFRFGGLFLCTAFLFSYLVGWTRGRTTIGVCATVVAPLAMLKLADFLAGVLCA